MSLYEDFIHLIKTACVPLWFTTLSNLSSHKVTQSTNHFPFSQSATRFQHSLSFRFLWSVFLSAFLFTTSGCLTDSRARRLRPSITSRPPFSVNSPFLLLTLSLFLPVVADHFLLFHHITPGWIFHLLSAFIFPRCAPLFFFLSISFSHQHARCWLGVSWKAHAAGRTTIRRYTSAHSFFFFLHLCSSSGLSKGSCVCRRISCVCTFMYFASLSQVSLHLKYDFRIEGLTVQDSIILILLK